MGVSKMNDNFTGFSDADIKHLVDSTSTKMTSTELQNGGTGVGKDQRGMRGRGVCHQKRQSEMAKRPQRHTSMVTNVNHKIPEIAEDVETRPKGGSILKVQSVKISASGLLKGGQSTEHSGSIVALPEVAPPMSVSANEADIDALSEFQRKQQQMEEDNKQRKLLLQQALEDRTKRTREEARRLTQIEEELKKLDAVLSNDVSIIRDQIEAASHDFMEAQKRYDRAERDYLDAKQCLFNHRERKEMLTSHLCTIIEQNELRKAKKLSELMEKLDISANATAITNHHKHPTALPVKQEVKKAAVGSSP